MNTATGPGPPGTGGDRASVIGQGPFLLYAGEDGSEGEKRHNQAVRRGRPTLYSGPQPGFPRRSNPQTGI